MNIKSLLLLSFFGLATLAQESPNCYVTPEPGCEQIGSPITTYFIAKIFSLRFNIPFYYAAIESTIDYTSLDRYFMFTDLEKSEKKIADRASYNGQRLSYELGIINNNTVERFKNSKTAFMADINARIDYIDPSWVMEAKKGIQLKNIPVVNTLPDNCIAIAVHIRKGNGGGIHYDGELNSQQLFEFDRNQVSYIPYSQWFNYPFETDTLKRNAQGYIIYSRGDSQLKEETNRNKVWSNLDKIWNTKFPPEQYYVDQIIWLAKHLKKAPLFVQIFTDDKDPYALIERIKNATGNNANITFHYHDNRQNFYLDRLIEDLYNISRFPIFIRSQSYFSRVAELMGEHALVLYPVEAKWDQSGRKNIMTTIVVKVDEKTGSTMLEKRF